MKEFNELLSMLYHIIQISPSLKFKLILLAINLAVLFFLFLSPSIRKKIRAFYFYCKTELHLNYGKLAVVIGLILVVQIGMLVRNLVDLERIILQKIVPSIVPASANQQEYGSLPGKVPAADLYLPLDFSNFIATVKNQIPEQERVLYLGVEKETAKYYLYPRKLYQAPEYEWIDLPTEKILQHPFVQQKQITYLVRKYRPTGFVIEKIP
ncbi:MAG: hypothetical protein A2Y62_15970 [Candidatus Fischerbacteria bacterium RBG_13_37_8]|uniref:Uncharacterized protein n=1 Tax=Candidatus Fischerbacteria bacterium RBG_13_37_8 TaxID=1817863 RepID=A0A1F5VV34_9BACT|nr:MAG: hypothetical protein A2Y62_15970 [Candidatus Fischerbacteria bacterium RBG_13_37_8]